MSTKHPFPIFLVLAFIPLLELKSQIVIKDGFILQEAIRRKAEEASLFNCLIGGSRICAKQEVLTFYQSRLFFPVWKSENKRQALLKAIEDSPLHGLYPRDYYYSELTTMHEATYESMSLEQIANREILFTDAFLLYASHLINGKVNPTAINSSWNISQEGFYVADSILHYTTDASLYQALFALAPQSTSYKNLRKALYRYKALARQGGWEEIKIEEKKLVAGHVDSIAIPQIRKRLFITNDLSRDYLEGYEYDSSLVKLVIGFQKRHGLTADGEIGKATLKALNTPISDRISQIQVNLERERWLPRQLSNYQIRVNIPNFSLEVIRGNTIEREHKVIVGKFYRQPPVFTSKMEYLVFNPNWTVPPGILSKDVVPGVRKDKAYLKKKGLYVYDQNGKALHPDSVDWSSSSVYRYTYRQNPGPKNALGKVKFIFPNSHLVYIHDTPTKYLFNRSERASSSGCMRVDKAIELAKYLLNDSIRYTDREVDKILAQGTTRSIPLRAKPQVVVLYYTAWANEDAIVQFRNDLYKRDVKVKEALETTRPVQ